MLQISESGLRETLDYAIKQAIQGERDRILKVLREDALITTQIDITVLNFLVRTLGL